MYTDVSRVPLGAVISDIKVPLGHWKMTFQLMHQLILSLKVIYTQMSEIFCISAITNS